MRRRLTSLLLLASLAVCVQRSFAQQSAAVPARHPGEELTVYLITIGQGDAVWEKFGHNTLWIRDATTRTTISYNYGIFDFDQPGFVRRFIKGRMLYRMEALDAAAELAHYRERNRTVWSQRLNLTPQQKHDLREFLEWNWLPENRDYLYHYYYDNCSTRVRDALDRVLSGALRAQLAGRPTGATFRWHSLRLVGESVAVYAGLSLGLGRPTDRPIDAWEEGFLPMELMAHMRSVEVPSVNGDAAEPIVGEEETLFQSTRPAEASAAPNRWPLFLLAGAIVGGLIVLLARRARARRGATLGLAVVLATWGVIVGFFGVILAFLWIATDHNTSYNNQNLLHVNPLALVLAVAAPLAVLRRTGTLRGAARLAWPTAIALVALSIAGLLLRLLPGVGQVNGPVAALVLPLHIATVLSLYQSNRPEPSSAEDVSMRMSARTAA